MMPYQPKPLLLGIGLLLAACATPPPTPECPNTVDVRCAVAKDCVLDAKRKCMSCLCRRQWYDRPLEEGKGYEDPAGRPVAPENAGTPSDPKASETAADEGAAETEKGADEGEDEDESSPTEDE